MALVFAPQAKGGKPEVPVGAGGTYGLTETTFELSKNEDGDIDFLDRQLEARLILKIPGGSGSVRASLITCTPLQEHMTIWIP